ncbi:hypothetical protein Tsp_03520 [Trichinella spiralis]|uniref:hypothetical protein n=1 Tax=Trichinella spiralis TaxID=6334 RepID=UPI0001EFB424|nr:hypothetical protein Tsp_03520 [Trichinella spiralis]
MLCLAERGKSLVTCDSCTGVTFHACTATTSSVVVLHLWLQSYIFFVNLYAFYKIDVQRAAVMLECMMIVGGGGACHTVASGEWIELQILKLSCLNGKMHTVDDDDDTAKPSRHHHHHQCV